ncbi:class I SAM-dependent methyltransferase [Candidatus Woesearchaeota archaeon]|nr:class I SAM-dependent methyltransferase [Candidatus Woesearchaeota archaeon]
MKKQMLYHELAKYYDMIYSWKDYKKEAHLIKKLVSRHKKSKGSELLDVACGTGGHLKYLKNSFSCIGIDKNKEMLNIAKKKVRGVIFKQVDMINFTLNKKFDVIICLFSSIAYLKTYQNLEKSLKHFHKHLKSAGVMVIEGFITKSDFKPNHLYMDVYDGKRLKIARIGTSKIKNGLMLAEMSYLIGEKGKINYFLENHELGLFNVNKVLKIIKKFGLMGTFIKGGLMKDRGLFIGVKI